MITPCVIYAAKSTEDRRGSIPGQLAECRGLAAREGWLIVGEYIDEGFSAYKRNRGPGLADARERAAQAALEHKTRSILLSVHSDRISRGAGDSPDAAEALVEIWHAERRRNVHLRSVEDDYDLQSSASVANIGERNRADSARKSSSTKAGKRRRFFEQQRPVGGPVNDGYRLLPKTDSSGAPVVGKDGRVQQARHVDPVRAPLVRRLFDLIEAGHTPGEVARVFNAEGARTRRGCRWTARTVRETASNPFYAGWIVAYGDRRPGGHEPLIEPARFDSTQASIARMDPEAVARRAGGRRPAEPRVLRGVSFCRKCGGRLYLTPRTRGGQTVQGYRCREARQSTGLCNARWIPAELAETGVLWHLNKFVGDVGEWLAEQVDHCGGDYETMVAAAKRERGRLAKLDREKQLIGAKWRDLLAAGDPRADLVLDQLKQVKAEQDVQRCVAEDSEARAEEWRTEPDVDAALGLYNDIAQMVRGEVASARTAEQLNLTLRRVLEGVWLELTGGDVLCANFMLKTSAPVVAAGRVQQQWRVGARTEWLRRLTPSWLAEAGELDGTPLCRSSRWRPGSPCRRGRERAGRGRGAPGA